MMLCLRIRIPLEIVIDDDMKIYNKAAAKLLYFAAALFFCKKCDVNVVVLWRLMIAATMIYINFI